MRVALVAPDWGNSWIPLIKAEVERRGHAFSCIRPGDSVNNSQGNTVAIHAWADQTGLTPMPLSVRNVMFMRRYELFNNALPTIRWQYVSDLILVNSWIKGEVDQYFKVKGIKTRTHLIYNAVDTSQWTFKERKPNHRIGMACHVHPKKNLPLALEVLANLPEHFELHIAGAVQDMCTHEYLDHLARQMRRKVILYGHIDREHLNLWWDQMGFCLSTSISEGNPNNVLEAMAKGIKPVVLNWPGAEDQFSADCMGYSAAALAFFIQTGPYESLRYRQHVEKFHSLDNISRAVDIALGESQA